ncbi:MAG: hypothetical protein JXD23_02825 [Spirochaetales bacterium]|nr:hypothetical protein [Spirochaetales bacterium]
MSIAGRFGPAVEPGASGIQRVEALLDVAPDRRAWRFSVFTMCITFSLTITRRRLRAE